MDSKQDDRFAEIAALNRDRSILYRLLSSLFWRELNDNQIEQLSLAEPEFPKGETDLMEQGWSDMQAYLAKRNSGTRQELAVDYAHTFLAAGNNDDRMAIPFESVFMSETGLLMQEPRDEVCKAFLSEHVSPSEELHTPEDHIAFELEFLAVMAQHQNEALESNDVQEALRLCDVQASFHEQHLLNWVDVFCDAIKACCRTQFYRGVADLTRGWVRLDEACIAEIRRLVEDVCPSPATR